MDVRILKLLHKRILIIWEQIAVYALYHTTVLHCDCNACEAYDATWKAGLTAADEPFYVDHRLGDDSHVWHIFIRESVWCVAHCYNNSCISCSPAPRHHQFYQCTVSTVIHSFMYQSDRILFAEILDRYAQREPLNTRWFSEMMGTRCFIQHTDKLCIT